MLNTGEPGDKYPCLGKYVLTFLGTSPWGNGGTSSLQGTPILFILMESYDHETAPYVAIKLVLLITKIIK